MPCSEHTPPSPTRAQDVSTTATDKEKERHTDKGKSTETGRDRQRDKKTPRMGHLHTQPETSTYLGSKSLLLTIFSRIALTPLASRHLSIADIIFAACCTSYLCPLLRIPPPPRKNREDQRLPQDLCIIRDRQCVLGHVTLFKVGEGGVYS